MGGRALRGEIPSRAADRLRRPKRLAERIHLRRDRRRHPDPAQVRGAGWHCQEIDGHDIRAIASAVEAAKKEADRPSAIIAHTVKGKGVPFMENDNSWHKRVPTKEQYEEAMRILSERVT